MRFMHGWPVGLPLVHQDAIPYIHPIEYCDAIFPEFRAQCPEEGTGSPGPYVSQT
jgi:hypothetical protein